jgi:magnesium transporter
MLRNVQSPEIRRAIEQHDWKALARVRHGWPDPDVVAPEIPDFLRDLEKPDRVLFYRALPRDLAVEVFAHLDHDQAETLLHELTDAETRHLLAELEPDDRTELLEELPGRVTQRLLNMLSPDDLREARRLLGYPEESVGRVMTPDYVAIRPDWTIARAIEHIRDFGRESESLSVIYVTDRAGKLVDALPLQRVILGSPDEKVEDIMDHTFVSLSAYEDREQAVRMMGRYDRLTLPVVDSSEILLGIITIDDVMDIAEEETTEDFQRQAAVAPLGRSYWEAGVWILFRSRIGWLFVLVLVNLLSSGVIAAFEDVLAASVALAFFIPLIIDTGGNAGSQSAVLMIRSISTGEIRLTEWFRVVGRELLLGLAIGIVLGLLGMALGTFRGGILIGLVVLMTMVTMIFFTNMIGVVLPFVLTRFKLDPAIASGPLITSIADAVGLIIYFSYAVLLIGTPA